MDAPGHADAEGTQSDTVVVEGAERDVGEEEGGDTRVSRNESGEQRGNTEVVENVPEDHGRNSNIFQCKENEKKCKKTFKTKLGLESHMRRYHAEKKEFACQECDKSFPRLHALAAHQKIHLKPTYSCDICGKVVKHKHHLQQHVEYHHEEVSIQCAVCDRIFLHRVDKRNHDKTCQKKETKLKYAKHKGNTKQTEDSISTSTKPDKIRQPASPAGYDEDNNMDSAVDAAIIPSEAGLPGDGSDQTVGGTEKQAKTEEVPGQEMI